VLNKMLTQKSKKVLRVNAGRNSGLSVLEELPNIKISQSPKGRQGSIPCTGIVAKSLKAAGGI